LDAAGLTCVRVCPAACLLIVDPLDRALLFRFVFKQDALAGAMVDAGCALHCRCRVYPEDLAGLLDCLGSP